MFKKTIIAFALLAVTGLSGCVVYAPPRPVVYGPGPYYGPGPAVVVDPVPVVGFWGWGHYGYGYHGGRWR